MKHIHFKEIDSTQIKACEMAKDSGELLISAEKQLKGRGRRSNVWEDLDNSLAMSFKLEPTGKQTLLALEVSVLICKYFENDKLKLKWPNDIYNSEKQKVAGVLVNKEGDFYIVGVGLNFGPNQVATSKSYGMLSSGYELSDDDYKDIPHQIYKFINSNRLSDKEIRAAWNKRCFHVNDDCRVVDGDDIKSGKFLGIGEYGEALIEANGKIEKAYTGSLLFK